MRPLSRATAPVGPRRPVRLVHLGLGAFHRAHQAWYTQNAGQAWGIAAYTGRGPTAARALAQQDGLYVLLTRGPEDDRAEVMSSISRAHDGSDTAQWLADLTDQAVTTLTLSVTEAGYRRNARGDLDLEDIQVQADVAVLRADLTATVHTAPARIAQGLIARHRRNSGPLNVISCDNVADNGEMTRRVVLSLIEAVEPDAVEEIDAQSRFVDSVVDRITPATTETDRQQVASQTGYDDRSPVVTEPFSEWVIADRLTSAVPDWSSAGATVVSDVAPFEERKLWLLNGGHSLLAYAGSIRGHRTVAEAVADPALRMLLLSLWDAAAGEMSFPRAEVDAYCLALLNRFENSRIEHRLAQIVADGSQKIPLRIVPVLRRRRERGLAAAPGDVGALSAWLSHLRGHGAPVRDAGAEPWLESVATGDPRAAASTLLLIVAPDLAADAALIDAVADGCREFEGTQQ
jgi:fructuronate reductase